MSAVAALDPALGTPHFKTSRTGVDVVSLNLKSLSLLNLGAALQG
jgi:hypothetical protein